MHTLTATFRIVTPMFLAGADQAKAELQAPSFKGAFRFWYRAIDPDFRNHESKIFGSTNTGQASFLLRLDEWKTGNEAWDPNAYRKWNKLHPGAPSNLSDEEQERWSLNGIRYFSYSLRMGENRRCSIPINQEFKITIAFRKKLTDEDYRRILASLWLFGHLGGIGSRSRRAFGSVMLTRWEESSAEGITIPPLPLAHGANSVKDWIETVKDGLSTLSAWFGKPTSSSPNHSILHGGRMRLFSEGHRSWEDAMDKAGYCMQVFRQRWQLTTPTSDYHQVKAHICSIDPSAATVGSALTPPVLGATLPAAPRRIAFGLPLTFRYLSLAYTKTDRSGRIITDRSGAPKLFPPQLEFIGTEHDRSASPVHVRIIKIGEKYHPLYLWMNAPLLPGNERITTKGNRSRSPTWARPTNSILAEFWKTLPAGEEIIL